MIGRIRAVQAAASAESKVSVSCEAQGCKRSTQHRKPLCSKHSKQMPYSVKVAEEFAKVTKLAKWGRLAIDCTLVRDVAALLSVGPASAGRISRDMGMSIERAAQCLRVLEKHGQAEVYGLGRKTMGRLK